MSGDTKKKFFKKPSRKTVIITAAVVAAAAVAWFVFGQGLLGGVGGGKKVEFKQLAADEVPKSIETDVIPEYRELERALGCLIDGKVYVIVTRGEKPTAGYEVAIDKMTLEKTKAGTNMKVHATFTEPQEGVAVSQVVTYPYAVASTDLTSLPDTIELIVKYAE